MSLPQYATFWQRLTAFMLDVFIVALPVFTITLTLATPVFFNMDAIKNSPNKDFEIIYQLYKNGVFISLTAFAAVSFILAIFATSRWQATPGKRIVNIYLASRNGEKLQFSTAFERFFSLPLFLLMIQIFERRENYAALDELKRSHTATANLDFLQTHLNGPATKITGFIVMMVIMAWFLRIFFTPEKTAMHDTLFNTRVFKGKK